MGQVQTDRRMHPGMPIFSNFLSNMGRGHTAALLKWTAQPLKVWEWAEEKSESPLNFRQVEPLVESILAESGFA